MFFIGKYFHNIDEKGRLILPSKLRDKFGSVVYCTLGLEKCLALYPEEGFMHIVKQLQELSYLQKDKRDYKRTFFSNSCECEIDKQGRILLPKDGLNKTYIQKEVIIVGVDDHVEIWDKTRYEEIEKTNDDNYEENASNIDDCYMDEGL